MPAAETRPERRIEIVHESLLTKWPRLERWRTQDAEGAQLRDELRQAAQLWEQHGRVEDFLWTGMAYREFQLWRERYPGGLTEMEEGFAAAMTSFALRRRRRRRAALVAAFVLLLAVLGVVGSSRRRAVLEAQRAEAAKLVALGEVALPSNPTASLAHVIASLELAEGPDARLLALRALWKGPTSFAVTDGFSVIVRFAGEGGQLVYDQQRPEDVAPILGIVHENGEPVLLEAVHKSAVVSFPSSSGSTLCSVDTGSAVDAGHVVLWSVQEARRLADFVFEKPEIRPSTGWFRPGFMTCSDERSLVVVWEGESAFIDAFYPDGSSRRLGPKRIGWSAEAWRGRWIVGAVGEELYVTEAGETSLSEPRLVGRHGAPIRMLRIAPDGRWIATSAEAPYSSRERAYGQPGNPVPETGDLARGAIRLWDPEGRLPTKTLQGPEGYRHFLRFGHLGASLEACSVDEDRAMSCRLWSLAGQEPELVRAVELGKVPWPGGDWAWNPTRPEVAKSGPDVAIRLWPAGAPSDAEPIALLRGTSGANRTLAFHPQGSWIANSTDLGVLMWPLGRSYAAVLRRHTKGVPGVAFAPNGKWLASASIDGTVGVWPLEGAVPDPGRLLAGAAAPVSLAASSDSRHLLVGNDNQGPTLFSLESGEVRTLKGFEHQTRGVAFSPDGELAAAVGGDWNYQEKVIRVWSVASGEEVAVLGPDEHLFATHLEFVAPREILSGGSNGLTRWHVETGRSHVVYSEALVQDWALSADKSDALLIVARGETDPTGMAAVLVDLETGADAELASHGRDVNAIAFGPRGDVVVTGSTDGTVRVGRATGEEPHLLLGHERGVVSLAVDPLSRWIASGSPDTTVRLWPMPDLSQPPLHTLPHEELLAKLRTLTNYRVVRDAASRSGWKLTHDPFPGWQTVPTW